MGQTLTEIAQTLKDANKKVQLIYAFNGTGKTRLSREFKRLIAPKNTETEELEDAKAKILYYNAFTEDLFYWDNDLNADTNRKLKIQPNSFTDWVFRDQGQENNIITHFQHYTSDKLMPKFNERFNEITFSIAAGNENTIDNIKISKGEESCLIWCVFYSLLAQVVEVLNIAEPADRETDKFNLKSATKLFSVLLASKRPLITELADKLRLKYPLLPTISPCPTMRLEAIRSIIPISCRRYPKSV